MIITVSKFEDKSKSEDKVWFCLTDENGKEHNLFSSNIPDLKTKRDILQEGMTVKLTKVKNKDNPKWWDTTNVEPSTAQEAVKKEESSQYAFKYHEQEQMNHRTALMQAVTTSQSKDLDDIVMLYHAFCTLLEGNVPPDKPEPTPAKPSEVTVAPISEQPVSFKTKQEAKNAITKLCNEQGWGKSNLNAYVAVTEALGLKSVIMADWEIKDYVAVYCALNRGFSNGELK